MDAADREKTAFVTQGGLFEFRVMPFGVSAGRSEGRALQSGHGWSHPRQIGGTDRRNPDLGVAGTGPGGAASGPPAGRESTKEPAADQECGAGPTESSPYYKRRQKDGSFPVS